MLVAMNTRRLLGDVSLSLTVTMVLMTSSEEAGSLSLSSSELRKVSCETILERLWMVSWLKRSFLCMVFTM